MGFLAWIGYLIEWLASWLPRPELVQSNECWVRFGPWKTKAAQGPAVPWSIPALQEISSTSTARQVLDTAPQTLTTADGASVAVAATVLYRVVDPQKFLVENYEAEDAVADVCEIAVWDLVTGLPFEALLANDRKTTQKRLTKEVSRRLEELGCVVEYARLTNMAKARVLSHIRPGGAVTEEEES
jgi:regulator of protease activity HflC (stomatin/prohibitin superfamily)